MLNDPRADGDTLGKSGYALAMFRKTLLLLCLLVTSLMTATVVHAQEFSGLTELECAGEVHTRQDGAPASGDTDKAVAHHHGCHSVSSFLQGDHAAPQMPARGVIAYALPKADALASLPVGPDLRPPIA